MRVGDTIRGIGHVWLPLPFKRLPPAGVVALLRPLLLDVVPSIQQTAALAVGRLADHSDDLAEAVVKEDILPQLVHSLASQNVSISFLSLLPLSLCCRINPHVASAGLFPAGVFTCVCFRAEVL